MLCGTANTRRMTSRHSRITSQGKGDLVREFVDAFRARGLKVGLYYCLPGDYSKNKLQPGQTDLHGLPPEAAGDYVKFIKLQLTELLTQYGAVDLMWFDQYNNKYTRAQWGEIKAHVHSLQPDCLVLANNSTNFKKTDIHGYEYPWLKDKKRKALPAENNTNAAEVCDCITPGAWYWQTNLTEKSVTSAAEVVDMLKLCNSRQANYLLNVPPDRTGAFRSGWCGGSRRSAKNGRRPNRRSRNRNDRHMKDKGVTRKQTDSGERMKTYKMHFVHLFSLLLLGVGRVKAAEYHVSLKGDPAGDGSYAKPFKMISDAHTVA